MSPSREYRLQRYVLDFATYEIPEVENGILFTSPPDTRSGFRYFKEIRIDQDRQAFNHRYRIRNISDSPRALGGWEVTRL